DASALAGGCPQSRPRGAAKSDRSYRADEVASRPEVTPPNLSREKSEVSNAAVCLSSGTTDGGAADLACRGASAPPNKRVVHASRYSSNRAFGCSWRYRLFHARLISASVVPSSYAGEVMGSALLTLIVTIARMRGS